MVKKAQVVKSPAVCAFDGVPVVLDRPRQMVYDFAAVKAFRRETGINLIRDQLILTEMEDENLTTLIWVGLLRDDPALTRDDVDRIVTMRNITDVIAAIAVAFAGESLPPEEDSDPLAVSRPA